MAELDASSIKWDSPPATLPSPPHIAWDPPTALGDTPDVFTEGAAQAAAAPAPLLPQLAGIGRGLVGAGEGALSAISGTVAPVIAGLGGLGAAATNAAGLTATPAADVVNRLSDALTYEPRTDAGKIAAAIPQYPFQKLAEAGRFAGEHVQDATGSPVAATAVDTLINALPLLLGARKGADVLREAPPVDTPRIEVAPPLENARVEPEPTAQPAPAEPAVADGRNPEPQPAAVPDAQGAAVSAPDEAVGPVPATFTAELAQHAPDVAADDHATAHEVATLAARAQAAGLEPESIAPFHGETPDEYIARTTQELTDHEARHADDAANAEDHPPDVRAEAVAPADAGAIPAAAEGQAADELPRSQAEPAATAASAEQQGVVEPPARAVEPVAPEPAATPVVQATKAATDAQRAQRGVSELLAQEPHEWSFANDAAQARIAADPAYPANLATEVLKSKRPVNDVESMALLNERVRLQQQHADAVREADAAQKAGDTPGELRARLKMDQAETALDTNERAARYSKSEVARSLNATKAGLTQDYSLAHTLTRAKIAYGDKFGPAARARIEELTAKIKEREDAIAELQKKQAPAKPAAPRVKKTPDERMQARVNAEIERLKGQIEQRLKACPLP